MILAFFVCGSSKVLWNRWGTSRRIGWSVCSSSKQLPHWRPWVRRRRGTADKRPCISLCVGRTENLKKKSSNYLCTKRENEWEDNYLDHLVVGLETSGCDFGHAQLLVIGLFGREHRSVSHQWEVNSRVGHQIGLYKQIIDCKGWKRRYENVNYKPGIPSNRRWGRLRNEGKP